MDVTKMPAPGTGSASAPSSAPEQGAQPPARTAAIADRADIRPLDIPAALQILLAEVRASFELQAIVMGNDAGGAGAESETQAARALLQMVLQALPDETASSPEWNAPGNAAAWSAAMMRVDAALQEGFDRAISAVAAWRDVPASVVDAAQQTRTLVFAILGDDPQNPIWLRPEWAGLAPRFERFWRRRRFVRRRLADPDYSSGSFDDNEPRS
ncbi:MAG TPA: hypothetical protein VK652_14200 [Steroidobacteraceae bacterium]|nr:hypothetical protein [Steroidobacteraceae bacterium]